MKSLLRTFFIPTLKTRIKWLVIITLGLFTASLFQVRVLIIVLISLSIGFLLLSDFSSFNFAKNTSWLTNSYYNKKTLLKYFYINQFLRSILLSLSCLIVTGIGFLLLINISDTHHLDLVTNKILDGSVTKTHAPIQTSGLGNFRTLLSLGFLYFIGPIVMYFCPNALHQTPQDIYRKKFKNAFGDHNYKNYLLNLIWIIPLVFIQVFQLWSKLQALIPIAILLYFSYYFIHTVNAKFNLAPQRKLILPFFIFSFMISIPHLFNLSLSLGTLHNQTASLHTKLKEHMFLGVLTSSPPKHFIESSLEIKDLDKDEFSYLLSYARKQMDFIDVLTKVKNPQFALDLPKYYGRKLSNLEAQYYSQYITSIGLPLKDVENRLQAYSQIYRNPNFKYPETLSGRINRLPASEIK